MGSVLAQEGGFVQPDLDYHALAPELVLAGVLVVVLLLDLFADEDSRWALPSIAGIGVLGALVPVVTLALDGETREMFDGAYVVDDFALVFKALFLVTGYVAMLISTDYVAEGD